MALIKLSILKVPSAETSSQLIQECCLGYRLVPYPHKRMIFRCILNEAAECQIKSLNISLLIESYVLQIVLPVYSVSANIFCNFCGFWENFSPKRSLSKQLAVPLFPLVGHCHQWNCCVPIHKSLFARKKFSDVCEVLPPKYCHSQRDQNSESLRELWNKRSTRMIFVIHCRRRNRSETVQNPWSGCWATGVSN